MSTVKLPPLPDGPSYMIITPHMADLWLTHCNPEHNRVLSDTVYERYARSMARGSGGQLIKESHSIPRASCSTGSID